MEQAITFDYVPCEFPELSGPHGDMFLYLKEFTDLVAEQEYEFVQGGGEFCRKYSVMAHIRKFFFSVIRIDTVIQLKIQNKL